MLANLDPALAIGILQTFLSLIQIRIGLNPPASQMQQTIVVLSDIKEEISSAGAPDVGVFIEERVRAQLPAEVATTVLANLDLLALMAQPPRVDSFDYWSILVELTGRFRSFCQRANIFRLRGLGLTLGNRILKLPRTANALFDSESQRIWMDVRSSAGYKAGSTIHAELFLTEALAPRLPYGVNPEAYLPLLGSATVTYIAYGSGGYGGTPPLQKEVLDVYTLPGPDVHWLWFISGREPGKCQIAHQRMLTGPAVLRIVNAMQEDVSAYVADILGDQAFSENNLRPSFEDLIKQLPHDR